MDSEPDSPGGPDALSPLARYKTILRGIVDNRPSGTRQRLAEALGKNRSFISQIVNPAYSTPIPAQHLETIFQICHVTPVERAAFLAAYREAHPGRLEVVSGPRAMREVTISIPDFGNAALNARAEALIRSLATGLAGLLQSDDDDPEARALT
ncbi:hypothetical protein D3874_06990 [Oleomonas cavernae]|uniref:Uncharacterized protein n=1 Tax=Oleomonas cavernae TaxID=2320859 RepID=A0A418W9Z4_9PROT|nr:hypothetical protein [Oleomonas cavernae]RJF86796.1 hypothetical protein D3874_06990 [Oleomonas cavernae]